ncbi:hypothetical protein AOQ84DRAFT_437702 [Glonium stellatum]|uniref:Prion-inhibition and propagation HeLo domain-containing protein n=1 Tax=Glonium stellatum TaxID=574774 RepID=A0A8E2F6M9_9PEZI|nr:hypothetical protein AOQ84DRAFT_437702 [Glonium stellatum]
MATNQKEKSGVLGLVQLFSTCVECFGLIHPSKDWDHIQRLLIAQLGIQQARLLVWGDNLGICDLGNSRDPRLDDPEYRAKIERALQSIIDRPAHTDRATQFEKYGLKPPKKFTSAYQPALDGARLEAFREKLEILQEHRWEERRGMSITITHWSIIDSEKFHPFLRLIQENVNALIELMGNEQQVDRGLKHDIKALGWHPIFDKAKVAADMSKLRLIKEACANDYPEYAAATQGALEYLDKEWKDSYEEIMERGTSGSEIPSAAAYIIRTAPNQLKAAYAPQRPKLPGFFSHFRPKSWRRNSKGDTRSKGVDETVQRSQSYAHPITQSSPPLNPQRSKSTAAIPTKPASSGNQAQESSNDQLALVETAKSTEQPSLEPVASIVSRHDQWKGTV